MRALSPRESRLVAVMILLALLALIEFAVIQPIVSGFADRAERRQALLLRYQANDRTIAAIPRLRRQAEAQNASAARFMLSAPDQAAAVQMLRDRAQAAVEAVGGDFRGGEDVPADAGWAAVRVGAHLSIDQLAALLAQIQNARPHAIVSSLVIGADEALVVGHSSTLDVQFEVSVPFRVSAAR